MYQSPFSANEIKYFMNLMQNDNTEGKGSTYAKLEVLLSKQFDMRYAANITKEQLIEAVKEETQVIKSLAIQLHKRLSQMIVKEKKSQL